MIALCYIATFLSVYFLLSIFFPETLFFFLPKQTRTRSLGIWLTIICVAAAIVFLGCSSFLTN